MPAVTIKPEPIRVLVTGFGPFREYKVNPSWLAVKPLHDTTLYTTPGAADVQEAVSRPVHITAVMVPTIYTSVLSTVPGFHARPPVLPEAAHLESALPPPPPPPPEGYDFIMHCGVAGRQPLRLETQAHKSGYNNPDATGALCPCVPGTQVRGFGTGYEPFPDILKTGLDIQKMKVHLDSSGVKGSWVSDDPGHYLCDFIYYCSLAQSLAAQEKYSQSKPTPVFFLHLPPVDEPMNTEQVTEGIKRIVEWVGGQL
ncbi:peptidase C15 pyroglutamyl peptidase I-like protein [Amylocystis lapponica]|nr:peptidase C15 pyroglutamyl peptidase I-like protein [Amylocystis lapponica]